VSTVEGGRSASSDCAKKISLQMFYVCAVGDEVGHLSRCMPVRPGYYRNDVALMRVWVGITAARRLLRPVIAGWWCGGICCGQSSIVDLRSSQK